MWALAKLGILDRRLCTDMAGLAAESLNKQLDDSRGAHHAHSRSDVTLHGGGAGGGGGGIRGGAGPPPASEWASQPVANLTWAYATLGVHPGNELLAAICRY